MTGHPRQSAPAKMRPLRPAASDPGPPHGRVLPAHAARAGQARLAV